jgi:hypothetical protein
MKSLLAIIFVILSFRSLGQSRSSKDVVHNLVIQYRPAIIEVLSDTGILISSTNNGNITSTGYTSIKSGIYKVQARWDGQPTLVYDNIVILKGQRLVLNFRFNGPCLFDRPKDYIPTCPKNHLDSIVPILYGLILQKFNKKTGKVIENDVEYGGCVVTGCDPQFYCKLHKLEF